MPVELYVALKGGRRSKVNNFALEKPAKDTRLILIPVSLGIHLTLIGIYIAEKVVIYLGSAVSPAVNVFRNILGYLERLFVHWKVPFSIEEWLLLAPRNVPKQKDNYSCGVFLCLNAYVLSSNDIVHYGADNVNKYRYWIAAKIIGGKHPPQLKLGNEQAERIYQSSSDTGRYIHRDIPDGTEAENQGFFHSRLLKLLCTRRELSNAPKERSLFSDDENDSFISEIFPSEPKEEEYDSQQSSSVSRSILSKTSSHIKTTKKQATIQGNIRKDSLQSETLSSEAQEPEFGTKQNLHIGRSPAHSISSEVQSPCPARKEKTPQANVNINGSSISETPSNLSDELQSKDQQSAPFSCPVSSGIQRHDEKDSLLSSALSNALYDAGYRVPYSSPVGCSSCFEIPSRSSSPVFSSLSESSDSATTEAPLVHINQLSLHLIIPMLC